ncbi:MAG TPA: DMT family transporter, partial [Novosphingobium sp.]|nr:DMT family transporter [Novosphingobium sp.]
MKTFSTPARPPARAPARPWADIGSFALIGLSWGSTWLVIKDQVSLAPVGWTVTFRFALAAAGMFALALLRRERLWLGRRGLALASLAGVLQFCANYQFVYRGERFVTSGLVAVIYALLMVPNALLGRLVTGARASGRFWLGSGVAMAGIGLLLLNEVQAARSAGAAALGIGFALLGMLCASVSNVAQSLPEVRRHGLLAFTGWAMLAGMLADAAFAIATDGAPTWPVQWRYWGGVGWLAVVGSVLTFPVYYRLILRLGAGRAAYVNVVTPVVAMALSTLVEGYRWG